MSQFGITTKVFWGSEKYSQFSKFIDQYDVTKTLVIVDPGVAKEKCTLEFIDELKKIKLDIIDVYSPQIQGEPTYDDLDKHAEQLKGKKPDLLVGIGGGTIMDLAKGISVLMNNSGMGIKYRGMNKVENEPVPFLAVPTTAGTGSEVTWTAAFIDSKDKMKLGINGKNVAPLCAILEPSFLTNSPASIAISAGLDSMVHAIEAVTAQTSNEITIMLGTNAYCMMFDNLPEYVAGARSVEVCQNLLLSAYIAGIAMMNAGGGPASGVSYPLGVHFNVPHGFAGGLLLPPVFDINISKGYTGYETVFNQLKLSCDSNYDTFMDAVEDFYKKIQAPDNLHQWNCKGTEAIEILTRLTMEQRNENLLLNPIVFIEDDVRELLKRVC